MVKTYNVESSVKEWFYSNRVQLFDDILTACEDANSTPLVVCRIRTVKGVTEYVIQHQEDVRESLLKCERHYVADEAYEKAARARDCGKKWEDSLGIYKEKYQA
jgi:hypothetical protein